MMSCEHTQGAVATAGQVVQWLRDEMKFISSASEIGTYIIYHTLHLSIVILSVQYEQQFIGSVIKPSIPRNLIFKVCM